MNPVVWFLAWSSLWWISTVLDLPSIVILRFWMVELPRLSWEFTPTWKRISTDNPSERVLKTFWTIFDLDNENHGSYSILMYFALVSPSLPLFLRQPPLFPENCPWFSPCVIHLSQKKHVFFWKNTTIQIHPTIPCFGAQKKPCQNLAKTCFSCEKPGQKAPHVSPPILSGPPPPVGRHAVLLQRFHHVSGPCKDARARVEGHVARGLT